MSLLPDCSYHCLPFFFSPKIYLTMNNWHLTDIDKIMAEAVSSREGLSWAEAEKRLLQNGPNEITEAKKRPAWLLFVHQFKDFMILVLVAAAVVSGLLGDITDTIVIGTIVLLNAVVGFVQEFRAEKAMEALKKMTVTNASVIRNNEATSIASPLLVTGDVILLEAGNIVPADIRLFEAVHLKVNESSLTGESAAVEKKVHTLAAADLPLGDHVNIAFKGTHITNGRGKGIVGATGMQTELGKIAGLLQGPDVQTPLQKRLGVFGRKLAYIILCICAIVFMVGYLRGENIVLMLLTALSLAVAAIPEALPAVITIALAIGAKKLVKKNALIRKLPAVETLGSVTYICTDKTGTLTLNKMTLEKIAGIDLSIHNGAGIKEAMCGDHHHALMQALALNNDVRQEGADKITGDPTEIALYEFAASKGYIKETIEKEFPRVAELPFDAERKCMTTIHRHGDKYIAFTKGK